jgi:hypothetical protein
MITAVKINSKYAYSYRVVTMLKMCFARIYIPTAFLNTTLSSSSRFVPNAHVQHIGKINIGNKLRIGQASMSFSRKNIGEGMYNKFHIELAKE